MTKSTQDDIARFLAAKTPEELARDYAMLQRMDDIKNRRVAPDQLSSPGRFVVEMFGSLRTDTAAALEAMRGELTRRGLPTDLKELQQMFSQKAAPMRRGPAPPF